MAKVTDVIVLATEAFAESCAYSTPRIAIPRAAYIPFDATFRARPENIQKKLPALMTSGASLRGIGIGAPKRRENEEHSAAA